jgi:hypothetical protein
MDIQEARHRLSSHLRTYYGYDIDDVEITDTKGYWVLKKLCGGRGHCQSPLHMFLFNEAPTCHTVSFIEPMRFYGDGGRFHSPYRTWQTLKDAEMERCAKNSEN